MIAARKPTATFPCHPRNLTSLNAVGMLGKYQFRTHALQQRQIIRSPRRGRPEPREVIECGVFASEAQENLATIEKASERDREYQTQRTHNEMPSARYRHAIE